MSRWWLRAVFAVAVAGAAAGCTGATPSSATAEPAASSRATPSPTPDSSAAEPSGTDRVVMIGGESYDCADLIVPGDAACIPDYQEAFNAWGDRLDEYVNSPIGPLAMDLAYSEVAAFGLAACILQQRSDSEDEFIAYVREFYPEAAGTAILPLWFGTRYLCPAISPSRNPGSNPLP